MSVSYTTPYRLSNNPIFVIIYEKDSKFPVNFKITIDNMTTCFNLTVEQTQEFSKILLHDGLSFGAWTEQCQHNINLKLEAYWLARGNLEIRYNCMGRTEGKAIILTSLDAKHLSKYINVSLKSNSVVVSKSIPEIDEDPMNCIKRRTDENLRKIFGDD